MGLADGSSWTVDSFTKAFVSNLKSYPLYVISFSLHIPPHTQVGFLSNTVTVAGEIFGLKSIAAYRSGLEINTNVTKHDAEEGLRQVLIAGKPVHIENKILIDYIFLQSLEVAQSYDLPMQIHTGFGDRDLDLRLSNPLLLRAVLDDKRYSKSRIVHCQVTRLLLQVYLDFGLAIPKLSLHGMISSMKQLLELAPINKVMFSTDGHAFPETFYLGAKKSREVVFSVLHDACIDSDLSIPEAVEAAKDILARNAIDFYKISSTNSVVSLLSNLSQNLHDDLDNDVSLVRIMNQQDEMVLAGMYIKPGEAWEYCPRDTLKRVSKILKDEFDLEMNAGFENEFILLKNITREGKDEWVPFDSSPYCSSSAFDAASPVLREVAAALQSLGISVEQIHAEGGKGQFELILKYTICTKAADNLVYTHEVIRAIARKHGLLATFIPKYALDDMGSGSHVHLSLWRNGQNVFMASDRSSKHGISAMGKEFMAGILHHLPSILAFIAPLPNSFDRLQPNTCTGAYLFWGNENKEAPLRASSPPGTPDGLVSNFEIKSFDGSANPYLGLAAILAAGIDGLRRHLPLPEPVDRDPNPNVLLRLPASLFESLDALHKDDLFKEFISDKWLTAIKAIRKAIIVKKYPAQLTLTAWINCMGAVQSAAFTVLVQHKPTAWFITSTIELSCILYAGVICGGIVIFCQFWTTEQKRPVFVSMFNPIGTVLVTMLAYFLFGEQLHLGSLLGVIIIIIGQYFLLWGKRSDGDYTSQQSFETHVEQKECRTEIKTSTEQDVP
ncbi:hypothetical protein Fmac_027830 [Flemingia macrophylla]|uniref:GS catalytic domain-containing protein n=1 Tax=Flemingia macrophylla TaxID=520843 RepID=A0ABD1LJ13_9FABA